MAEAVYIYRIMTSLSVKATDALEKAPAAKTLRNRWLHDANPMLGINANYNKLLICFLGM